MALLLMPYHRHFCCNFKGVHAKEVDGQSTPQVPKYWSTPKEISSVNVLWRAPADSALAWQLKIKWSELPLSITLAWIPTTSKS